MGRPFFYMRRVERAVLAINTVPVVAGGISCSTTVATFSAEELAVYMPLHFLEDQRSATTFTAGGLLDAFRKELPRLSQPRKLAGTPYIFALAGFSS
jgi:hypothetical protein